MVGKFGIPLAERRALGHDLDPNAGSAETYIRDSMAAPVRSWISVLQARKSKRSLPDQTGSGQFVGASGQAGKSSSFDTESSRQSVQGDDEAGVRGEIRGSETDASSSGESSVIVFAWLRVRCLRCK